MTPAEFRAWMERFGYTHKGAGERLGLATRTVSQYLGGYCAISQVVAMAVWADAHGYQQPTRKPAKAPRSRAPRAAVKPVAPLPSWRSHRE